LLGVAAFVLAADVISKAIVVARMADHQPIRLLGGALTITLTRNGGAAFSIGTSLTIVFTAIAVGVIVYILRTARNLRSTGWAITLGLLLGGATGNLLDRIFRAPGPFQGHVVDWIQLPDWPVFNLADSSIVIGGILVVLLSRRGVRLDGTRFIPEARSPHPDASEPDSPKPASPAESVSPTDAPPVDASAAESVTPADSASLPSPPPAPASPPPAPAPPPDSPDPNYPKPEYPESDLLVSDHRADDGR
jgi:signal peptidase II